MNLIDGMGLVGLFVLSIVVVASFAELDEEDRREAKRKLIAKENNKILNEDNIRNLNDTQKKLAREYLSNPENTIPLTLKMVKEMTSKYNQKINHEEFLKNEKIKLEKQRGLLLNNDN